MKVGISITSSHNVKDVREGARRMIDRARAANEAGLDSLFVGDHHVMSSPYYQNTPMMGRLLAEWNSQDAGALFLLPLWNPVLAAEQIATLASITAGRFIMQCGLGRDEYQFNAMGANIKHRPSAFEQAIDSMRRLWRGEAVTLDGRWQFEQARISPLPPQPIDIWVGASAPAAIDRAARIGDAWLAEPGLSIEQARSALAIYQKSLAAHNKADPATIAIRRDIYVAKSQVEARQVQQQIAASGYRGIGMDALVIGDAQAVAAEFQAFGELGYTDIIVRNLHPDPVLAIKSTQRLQAVKQALA